MIDVSQKVAFAVARALEAVIEKYNLPKDEVCTLYSEIFTSEMNKQEKII